MKIHAYGEEGWLGVASLLVAWITLSREKTPGSTLRVRPAAVCDRFIFHVARVVPGLVVQNFYRMARVVFLCVLKNACAEVNRSSRDQHELNARTHCTGSQREIKCFVGVLSGQTAKGCCLLRLVDGEERSGALPMSDLGVVQLRAGLSETEKKHGIAGARRVQSAEPI